jgi:hypothetical protein
MSWRLVQRHQRYQRIAPVINDIAITIIVVLAMRECGGSLEVRARVDPAGAVFDARSAPLRPT